MLLDSYGRTTHNLRVSVTNRCNLKCIFCHKEGDEAEEDRLTAIGIEDIVRLATSYGVKKVKITGGEPLMRRDIVEIVNRLSSVRELSEVSMVTNGTLLEPLARPLKRAGLGRVNINIPSLHADNYEKVTGGRLESAIRGAKAAVEDGLSPVKINMVLLKGVNEGEVQDYIDFASGLGVQLQIIELEPIRIKPKFFDQMHMEPTSVEGYLEKRAVKSWARESMQKRRVFDLGNTLVEMVHPVENTEFCAYCSRLRLTSDGALKPCLMRNDNKVWVNEALSSEDRHQLLRAYLQSVMRREPFYRPIKETCCG